ncbi:ABC transporter substrate-binding protein [Terrarubrum flagellatum]|uniref:ABC transporter substrate-binding protein n=1 Tax=Terrirubrum flagellatum TaxID=2895980 RepID=UPI003144FD7D
MTELTRRYFNALLAGGAGAIYAGGARAQAANMSFMSFSFAEEANKALVQKLCDDFAGDNGAPMQVIGSAWGDVQKNLVLRQRSKTLPSSAQISERWLPSFASMPELADLNQVVGKDKLEAAIDVNVLNVGRIGGKQLALPIATGSIGMVANKEVLQKAGVDKLPETIAELRAALIAVRDKVPNSVPMAMATKNPASIPLDVLIWVWSHGGRLIDEDGKVVSGSNETGAAFEFMASLMKDRLIAPEIDRPDSRRLFGQGATAFYIDAPQARSFIRTFSGRGPTADAMVAPMKIPVAQANLKPVSMAWGNLILFFKTGDAAKDAGLAKWANYLISDKVQTAFPPALSALPVTKAARAAPVVANDAYFADWAKATGEVRLHELGVWPNAPELGNIVSEETQAALLGQKKVADAMQSMKSRLEASMAKRG